MDSRNISGKKRKQIDVVGVTTTKFTRESFFILWCIFLFGLGKATEQLDLSSTNRCTMLCESSSFSHTTLTNKRLCLVWVCLGQASGVTNCSFATNLKDPWWAGIAEEETSQEILIGKQVRVCHNEPGHAQVKSIVSHTLALTSDTSYKLRGSPANLYLWPTGYKFGHFHDPLRIHKLQSSSQNSRKHSGKLTIYYKGYISNQSKELYQVRSKRVPNMRLFVTFQHS